MPKLNIQSSQAGLTGVLPAIAYINTNDTEAQVLATGYLNQAVQSGLASFSSPCMVCVSTVSSAGAQPDVGWYELSYSAGNWSLVSTASPGSVTLPTIANHIATYTNASGGLGEDAATAINGGNIQAGLSGTAGYFVSYPATAANGTLIWQAANAGGAFNTTVSNVTSVGQSQVISIPDCGTTAAKFLLDTGTGATATITKISTGATPVPLVDPGSCTITAAAGASNTATVTIQLKDGSGTNLARSVAFKVYASSTADGLTLASAASTGFSVASGGLSLNNGNAITTQISCMSSASGACVLSLLDTGKQTSYLVLVLPSGNKISAQLTSGSYG